MRTCKTIYHNNSPWLGIIASRKIWGVACGDMFRNALFGIFSKPFRELIESFDVSKKFGINENPLAVTSSLASSSGVVVLWTKDSASSRWRSSSILTSKQTSFMTAANISRFLLCRVDGCEKLKTAHRDTLSAFLGAPIHNVKIGRRGCFCEIEEIIAFEWQGQFNQIYREIWRVIVDRLQIYLEIWCFWHLKMILLSSRAPSISSLHLWNCSICAISFHKLRFHVKALLCQKSHVKYPYSTQHAFSYKELLYGAIW